MLQWHAGNVACKLLMMVSISFKMYLYLCWLFKVYLYLCLHNIDDDESVCLDFARTFSYNG